MSEELESVGALSTATLAATALEEDPAAAHGGSDHGNCANCRAPLTGPFCRMCGQPAHIHRSLLHLLEEVLHGVFHFDAKGWRTIPLLVFKPGALTRRYIDGQRKTYVSPLALFLFMVFLMFFVASLGGNGNVARAMKTEEAIATIQSDIASQTQELTDAKAAVEKARAALEAARKLGGEVSEQQEELDDAIEDQKSADADLQRFQAEAATLMSAAKAVNEAKKQASQGKPAAPASASAAAAASGNYPSEAGDDSAASPHSDPLQEAINEVARERGAKGANWNWVDRLAAKLKDKPTAYSDFPAVEEALKHAANNPELAFYKLKNTTYKYSFMLVPISLPFLWLMFFWRRGIAMFDHAVFVLYSLCFMSLLFDCVMLAGMAGRSGLAASMALFLTPVHMFVQLRDTYGLGIFSALWRTLALSIVTSIVMVLFLLLVLVLSMH